MSAGGFLQLCGAGRYSDGAGQKGGGAPAQGALSYPSHIEGGPDRVQRVGGRQLDLLKLLDTPPELHKPLGASELAENCFATPYG
jgi:hypothetical protein